MTMRFVTSRLACIVVCMPRLSTVGWRVGSLSLCYLVVDQNLSLNSLRFYLMLFKSAREISACLHNNGNKINIISLAKTVLQEEATLL